MSIAEVEKVELHQYAQFTGCDFVFYDKFVHICEKHEVSPSRAAIEAGLSKSTVSKWKNTPDAEPTGAAIKKLCDYFQITVSELLNEDTQKAPTTNGERSISNAELKFALWGDCEDVSDDDLADVLRYAAFVRERKKDKE